MTLQLELTKTAEQILTRNAQQNGMELAEYATYLLEKSLQNTTGVELLEQWLSDKNPESITEQTQTFQELQKNLDQNRVHSARKLFSK